MLESVEWCSVCNGRPADGTLTIEEPGTSEYLPLPACLRCVAQIPNESWVEGKVTLKETRHDD